MAENLGGIYWTADIRTEGLLQGQKQIDKSVNFANASFSRAEKGAQRLNTQMSKTAKGVQNAVSGMGRRAGQAGIQIQQFVGQVQGGQNAMLALSQQAADLGFVLGAPLVGAIAGLAASFAMVLLPNLFDADDATDELTKTLEALDKVTDTTSDGITELSDQLKTLAKTNEDLAKVKAELGIANAKDVVKASVAAIKEQLGDVADVNMETFNQMSAHIETSMGAFEDYTGAVKSSVDGQKVAMQELGEQFGLSGEQALLFGIDVATAFDQIQKDPSPDGVQEFVETISGLRDGLKDLPQDARLLLDSLLDSAEAAARAGNSIKTLEAFLEGGTDATQDFTSELNKLIGGLNLEVATLGKSERQIALYVAGQMNATQAQIDAINTLYDKIEAHEKEQESTKKSKQETDKAVASYNKLKESLQQQQNELLGTEAVRAAFIATLYETGIAAGKTKEDIDALAASYRELWAAQDQQKRDDSSEKRLEQLKQEIALQNIRNQLGNEQAEIQAAIMALGENATPQEQQEIANLVAQMQALRAEAELLGPSLQEAFNQTVTGGLDQLSQGLASIITQGASAREVIANLAGTVANELLSAVIRYWLGQAAAAVMGTSQEAGAKIAADNAATASALANLAIIGTATTALASELAAAWGTAAIAASIATGGAIATTAAPIFIGAVGTMGAALAGAGALSAGVSGATGAVFGGGRAAGGSVSPNTLYRVNEKEPEMFVSQGQQYLMPNMRGEVMNSKQVGGGSKSTIIIENHTGAPVTTRDESTSDERIERVIIGSIRGRKGVFKAITDTTTANNKVGGG